MSQKKISWKPGNMVYPVPAVMVTAADKEGNSNIITVAWTGTVCTNPPMAYISVRPERHSYSMLKETGEFVINLTTEELAYATDYCGVRSGRDVDKWKETGLTPQAASKVSVPLIAESPVSIECRVTEVKELGSHHMFLADVVAVDVDEQWMNESGKLELSRANLMVYSHGEDYGLSKLLGTFGYSIQKDGKKMQKTAAERTRKKVQKTASKKTQEKVQKTAPKQTRKKTQRAAQTTPKTRQK